LQNGSSKHLRISTAAYLLGVTMHTEIQVKKLRKNWQIEAFGFMARGKSIRLAVQKLLFGVTQRSYSLSYEVSRIKRDNLGLQKLVSDLQTEIYKQELRHESQIQNMHVMERYKIKRLEEEKIQIMLQHGKNEMTRLRDKVITLHAQIEGLKRELEQAKKNPIREDRVSNC
jgi:hypothetical protein